MKGFVIFLGLFFFVVTIQAQVVKQEEVPQKVLDRFHFEFPQSVDLPVVWTKEKGNFKAQLTIMDNPAVMVLDSAGNTKRIERTIHHKYLPAQALSYVKKLDPDFSAIQAIRIVDDKGKETFKFSARIKTDFTFDKAGKLINTK